MRQKIKVPVAGIGNCASALIQGITFYRTHNTDNIPGIMFADIGGYRPANIEVVAAFDIDQRKVGLPLSQAIFAPPNCARVFQQEIQEQCIVQLGPILDGVAPHMETCHDTINFKPSRGEPVVPMTLLLLLAGALKRPLIPWPCLNPETLPTRYFLTRFLLPIKPVNAPASTRHGF